MHRPVSSEESLLVLSDNQLESSDAQAFAELGSRQYVRMSLFQHDGNEARVHVYNACTYLYCCGPCVHVYWIKVSSTSFLWKYCTPNDL